MSTFFGIIHRNFVTHHIVFQRKIGYVSGRHNQIALRNVSIIDRYSNVRYHQTVSTLKPTKRKTIMQKQPDVQRSSQARAIAIDEREFLLRYRQLQLLAILLSLATALGIYQIFIR